jgi:hypothetical protein
MWEFDVELLDRDRGRKYDLVAGGKPVPYSDVLRLWQGDSTFRQFFAGALADSPYAAFRWETPPITATSDRPFEFVLLRSDALERPVDLAAFAEQFKAGGKEVVTFPNLGGDAVMVVPCPLGPDSEYGHLASFVRSAPKRQVDRLWQAVGDAMKQRLSDKPVWLSTAGMGVAWLHVRLDSRPKYYGYGPFTH